MGLTPFEYDDWWNNGYAIEFIPKILPACVEDFRIWPLIEKLDSRAIDEELDSFFLTHPDTHAPRHGNVGGHPRFIHYDPRMYGGDMYGGYDDAICLLSLGYIDEIMMFGTVGEACFLIKPDDLAKRDFSNLLYYRDF